MTDKYFREMMYNDSLEHFNEDEYRQSPEHK